jgi:hypothetical protein
MKREGMREYMIEDAADKKFAAFIRKDGQMNDATTPTPTLDLKFRVGQLRQLMAKIKMIEADHEKYLEPYKAAEKKLRAVLMQYLHDTGQTTAKTQNGSITWVDNTTYPIEDQPAFEEFVKQNEAWHMLVWRANDTRVKDYILEHKDPTDPKAPDVLPPGLRPNPHPHLRVTPPTKKKAPVVKTTGFDVENNEEM